MLEALINGARDGDVLTVSSGLKQIQAQICKEMMAIDPERAVNTLKLWANFLKRAIDRPLSRPFATLEEYLPYRRADVGEM